MFGQVFAKLILVKIDVQVVYGQGCVICLVKRGINTEDHKQVGTVQSNDCFVSFLMDNLLHCRWIVRSEGWIFYVIM